MAYDSRYNSQRSSAQGRPGARRYVLPPPPPSRSSNSHGFFTYWLPILVTGTIAVGGLAAWIWSERQEHDDDDGYPHDKPPRPRPGYGQEYTTQGGQPYPGPPRPSGSQPYGQGPPPPSQGGPPRPPPQGPTSGGEAASYYDQYRQTSTESRDVTQQGGEDGTWYGSVRGMMKRAPSPGEFYNSASKQMSAGVAAMGGALGSIMEGGEGADGSRPGDAGRQKQQRNRDRTTRVRTEEKEGFSDHERWSEEADEKQRTSVVEQESEKRAMDARDKGKGRAKKAVAVVVSADTAAEHDTEAIGFRSILSHLPSQRTSTTTDLFVLIYAPGLKSLPPLSYQPTTAQPPSTTATTTPATTPGSELQTISPRPTPADSPSQQFDAVYAQALNLVASPTQILPFTTKDGYVHILRHLAPGLVYVSDTLAGDEGEDVAQLKGWVGHTVLVAGDEGFGGLADTETEPETEAEEEESKGGNNVRKKERKARWYENSSFVGLGKDVEVVDAMRVAQDWEKRVGGRE